MELETVLQRLKANETELRASGVQSLAVSGSLARGEAGTDSDVDLLIKYDLYQPIDLIKADRIRTKLTQLVGRKIDMLSEPILKDRLRKYVYRDRIIAF